MKKFLSFPFLMLLAFISISCEDNNNKEEYFEPIPLDKDVYYCVEKEIPSEYEWDAMIIKNDSAVFAKRDTTNNNVLYFVNNIKSDFESGIFYLISEEGELLSLGNSKCILNYIQAPSGNFLSTLDDEGKIVTIPVETIKSNKSRTKRRALKDSKIWKGLMDFIDLGGLIKIKYSPLPAASKIKDIAELTENCINGKSNEFLYNVSKMTLIGGVTKVSEGAFAPYAIPLSLFFWEINNRIEKKHEIIREKLYGHNVDMEIYSIKANPNGTLSVKVSISGIRTIPKFLYNWDDFVCTPSPESRNYIMIGVLARFLFEPEYDSYEYCSQEIAVNLEGEDKQEFTLTLPSMPSGKFILRPYIRSNREEIFNKSNRSVHKKDVVYGRSEEYFVFNGRIKGYDIKLSEYSEDKNCLHFVYHVTAALSSIDGVEEWGIYEEKDGEKIIHKIPFFAEKHQNEYDFVLEDYLYPSFFDYNSFNAVALKYVGVYIKYRTYPGEEYIDNSAYSEPYELLLLYHKKPIVEIIDISYSGTKDFYDRNYPELYHGKISTFNVKLKIDTHPLGDVYGEKGGSFYRQKGGYEPHPYYYTLSNIEASVDEAYDENGYLNTQLYVLHYYISPDKGNNNLYYRYTIFGQDDFKLPSDKYIEFVYNSSQRAYTSAKLVKGIFPEYKLIEYE